MATGERVTRRDAHVSSGGQNLFVREVVPDAPRTAGYVLFVHGNTFPSTADFDLPLEGRSIAGHLARGGIPCCLFDHRGYGRSAKPPGAQDITVTEKVKDLARVHRHLLEQRSAASFHLVGLSSGCQTIAEFLRSKPALIRSIVLMGPCYLMNGAVTRGVRKLRMARLLNRVMGRPDDPYVTLTRRHLRRRLLAGEEHLISREVFDAFVDESLAGWPPGTRSLRTPVLGFPPLHGGYGPDERIYDVDHIDLPVLLVRGERDDFCCWEAALRVREDLPPGRASILVVPNVKHDLHLYPDPGRVFEEIHRFVSTHADLVP